MNNTSPRKPFSLDEDAQLGTLPDQEVADRLNRGLDGVRERRIALGIGTFRSSRNQESRVDLVE